MSSTTIAPRLSLAKLAARLGGASPRAVSPPVRAKIEALEGRLGGLLAPRVTEDPRRVLQRGVRGVRLEGGVRLESARVARTLRDADRVVCFVVTIGDPLEREVAALQRRGRISEAFVLDAMGSVAAEDLADRFQQSVDARVRDRGLRTTVRFSPGYCDWTLAEQRKLFRILDGRLAGVRLHESCLMTPRKSVSGAFGLMPVDRDRYRPCADCPKVDCAARRAIA